MESRKLPLIPKYAFRYSGAKTKKELIHTALKEFVERKRRLNLLDLEGKIEFAEGYDNKEMRLVDHGG